MLSLDDFCKLSPKAEKCMRLAAMIVALLMIAAAGAVWLIFRGAGAAMPGWLPPLLIGWSALWLAWTIISPAIRYRRYRYLIDSEKIVVREGLWFITQAFAPIERVHQIAVKCGPIDRAYGLAKVIATTAGGQVVIRFLEMPLAEEMAANLQDKVRYILKQQGISVDNMADAEAQAHD